MRAYVTDHGGKKWRLPRAIAWGMEYTSGTPCDSFWFRCPWDRDNQTSPRDWVGFSAAYQGEVVFTGVVDECELSWSGNGSVLEVSGRGMAALLLDNEALGQDYQTATLADILADHVTPYGVQVAPGADLPAVDRFSVATGSSEWSVVQDFARYHGGITPRFDRQGRLVLTDWPQGGERVVEDNTALTALSCRDKRYGVLSQILVRDRTTGGVETVDHEAFLARGGRARRVLTMPGRSNYKAMRYSGGYQLDRSAAEWERVELTLPQLFAAWPGELIRLKRSGWARNGLFRVAGAEVAMDEKGGRTRLELVPPDTLL